MLPKVITPTRKLEKYQQYITKKQLKEINELSAELKGIRVNLVNSTPRGGGVAEILKSLVPLMKGVGLKADWYTIPARNSFFKITKEMHNALQGKEYDFPFSHRKKYLRRYGRVRVPFRKIGDQGFEGPVGYLRAVYSAKIEEGPGYEIHLIAGKGHLGQSLFRFLIPCRLEQEKAL